MATVGSLVVELSANVARLQKDLGRASAVAEKRSRDMQRTFANTAKLIGASFAGISFGALVKSVADTGDKLQKLSISLGVSTEALSQYRLVAQRAGTNLDSLTLIWQRQTRRVAEAAVGTGEARSALRELGLEAEALNRLSPDRQFEVIADAMSRVENSADRLRLAFKLYDSKGARPALQAMEGGAAAMRAMRSEADALGLTMTRVQANQMAAFNDQLTNARAAITGAVQAMVLSLGPALVDIARAFSTAVSWAAKFIDRLRSIENRTNIDGLRESLTAMNESAVELAGRIETIRSAGGNTTALEQQLTNLRDRIGQTIDRLRELQSQSESIDANIPDFQASGGGPLPSLQDEAQQEKRAREQQKFKDDLAERVDALRESLLTESELEQERFAQRADLLAAAREQEIISLEEFNQLKEDLEAEHQERMRKIRGTGDSRILKFSEAIRSKDLLGAISSYRSLIAAGANYNKTLFRINKVAAIAEATVATYQGAAQALAQVPYPENLLAAASVVAAGIAQVQQIASTSFGGGGGGRGGSSAGAVPTFNADPTFGTPQQDQQQPQSTEITVNLDGSLQASAVRSFIEHLNEQIEDGVVIAGIRAS